MIRNYFKIAWRNLNRNRFYSFINICGLAFGMSAAILLLLWVQYERSFDRFHADYRNIYRIAVHFDTDGREISWGYVPGSMRSMAQSFPQVKNVVRITEHSDQVLSDAGNNKVMDGFMTAYVDSTLFSVFDFKVLHGTPSVAHHNSVLITTATALKFFGKDDVVGEVIRYRGNNFTVTGVLDNFPENSSFAFDALFPMQFYAKEFTEKGGNGEWKTIEEDMGNFAFNTFVQLEENADLVTLGKELSSMYEKARNGESAPRFELQALKDLHLVGVDGNNAPARMVTVFLVIAVLILVIAAINYINLATARAMVRMREISIRKIVGAAKIQLFFQFISETALLFLLALLLALGLIISLLPMYNLISGKALHFSLADPQILFIITCTAFGTLLAAAVYPALFLAGFRPLEAIKGKMTSRAHLHGFRKVLVVVQFTISVTLIVATLVMSRQMDYIRKKDLGFDKNHVFRVPLPDKVADHIDAIKNELSAVNGILNVSLSDIYDISNHTNMAGGLVWPGKPDNKLMVGYAIVDQDFLPAMEMQLLEGRNFAGSPADSNVYILNETAVKALAMSSPYAGQKISLQETEGTIIGVVRDFNFRPVKEKIGPMLFFRRGRGNILYIRTAPETMSHAIAAVEQQYKKYAGDVPFSYSFIDEQLAEKYITDQRSGLLFNIFAAIAIFISCLGLLGLSTYTIQQRVKEIGIRKVLGAGTGNLLQLLSRSSIVLVMVSFGIATPIAWWAMNKWLENFAYRIELEWWIFASAGLVAVGISLLTVSFQTLRAALANPVKSLRSE